MAAQPIKVLLVEDNPGDIRLLREILAEVTSVQFELAQVEQLSQALQYLAQARFDVILLDLSLPDSQGLETFLRIHAQVANVPIVVLTGLDDETLAVRAVQQGAQDYFFKGQVNGDLLVRSIRYAIERNRGEEALRQQAEREHLVAEIAQRIRQSLNLEEILNTTVSEVRRLLQTDRVFIYRFEPDWSGIVVVESVAPGWSPILGTKIKDSFFAETDTRKLYQQGRVQATADIHSAGLANCHINLLAQLQVQANLVVPIVQGEQLWGLLVVNHCVAPRQWQQWQINLLQQLATQVAIAIQQSELYQQAQAELVERKRAEQKIREQAALLDIATDAIMVRDLEHQILFWNKGAEHLYGWKADEALGKNVNQLLFKETPSHVEVAQETVIKTGKWQGELHQVTKAGQPVTVECRWTLVSNDKDHPKSILVVGTDITEKKKLEAQFLRAQRMESIGTLAGGIAHDLNNVLAPILMSVQLLQRKLQDAQSQRLLATLETNTKRGADLIKQVLSFARGLEGKRTVIQIKHLILEIEKIAKETFPKAIKFQTNVPTSSLWLMSGDATQLHQVLMNLCVNARDAMPNGGTLHIAAENFFIDPNHARMHLDAKVGPYVVIAVSDTGVGISPEALDRIFEPFFTTKEFGKGTGLGLSTVMGIIKGHGGFVSVSSKVGVGTDFKVYLPAVETTEISHVKQNSLSLLSGQGEWILIVDDESSIQEVMKASLEAHGYRVLTAGDGVEAITLYTKHQENVSVVLTDIMMPSMDGLTAIRLLKGINPRVKIIATSGLILSDKAAEVANMGVKVFLSKPYTAEELLKTVQRVLHQK